MKPFFPFMYKKKDKEKFEPLPLYIEDYVPPLEKIEEIEEKDYIIIIDLT